MWKTSAVVLLAEFDIERGSSLKHQFPENTFDDLHLQDLIADHMLPDGCMNHEWVLTSFFLNRPPAAATPSLRSSKLSTSGSSLSSSPSLSSPSLSSPSLSSPSSSSPSSSSPSSSFLQSQSWASASSWFASALQRSRGVTPPVVDQQDEPIELQPEQVEVEEEEDWTLMDESAMKSLSQTPAANPYVAGLPFLYCCNLVHCQRDDSKRGATIRALAVAASSPLVDALAPLLWKALSTYFCSQDEGVLAALQRAIVSSEQWRRGEQTAQGGGRFLLSYGLPGSGGEEQLMCTMNWLGNAMPLVLPVAGLATHSCHVAVGELVSLLDVDVLEVLHAVLGEYRVLVLTPGASPTFAVRIVFSLAALVAPPLNAQQFLERRVFPAVTMHSLPEFCNRPGYLAGTTNPFFQTDPTLWDLLLLHDARSPKRLQLHWSPACRRDAKSTGLLAPDRAFFRHVRAGVKSQLGDAWLVKQFRLYVVRLIDLATGVSEFGGDVRKNYELYSAKLGRVKSAPSFRELIDSEGFASQSKPAQQIAAQVRRLDFLINVYVDAAPDSPAAAERRRDQVREILRDCLAVVANDDTLHELLVQTTKFYVDFDTLAPAIAADFSLYHQVRLLFNNLAMRRRALIDTSKYE